MGIRERLVYAIELTTDGAQKGLKQISSSIKEAEGLTGKFKAGVKGVGDAFASSGAAQAALFTGVAALASRSIQASSALEESINAVNVAYKENADAVHALAEDSVESAGMSQRAFNELAVSFSSFADKISKGTGQSVGGVLDDLTTRVADFASVMNLDANDAAQVFMSTLSGETEPIRRFGKDVSAAAVEQYALAKGLVASKAELTESIKVQARYGLLMEQTTDTAGDFANTQGSLANQQRILAANAENLAASFGSKLTPVVADAAEIVNDLISSYDSLKKRADALTGSTDKSTSGWLKWTNPITAAPGLLHEVGDGVSYVSDKLETNRKVMDESTTSAQDLIQAEVDAAQTERQLADVRENSRQQASDYVLTLIQAGEANKQVKKTVMDAAEAMDRQREASEAVTDSLERQKEAALDLIGGEIGVTRAQNDAREATAGLNDELKEADGDLRKVELAVDAAAEAQLEAASAAAEYRAKQMEANGESVNADTKAQLLKEELIKLASQLDGPLAGAIQRYIDQLSAIPRNVTTSLTFNSRGDAPQGRGPRARGGRTYEGFHEVIENGPELLEQNGRTFLMSKGGGYVTPLAAMAASAMPAGVGGGTSRTLNIAPGAIVLQGTSVTPRDVVNAIKEYERFGGSAWRN